MRSCHASRARSIARPLRRSERGAQSCRRSSSTIEPGDARPRVLLERRALGGVEAVDRLDEGDEPARDEVVELAVRRELARLARREVLDHRRVGEDEPVTGRHILVLNPGSPQGLRGSGRGS